MNRSELIERLALRAGLSVEGARRTVEVLFGSASEAGLIAGALRQGERVQLTGFGTFEMRQRQARTGRNPQTQERLSIPAGQSPAFRAGTALRAQVR